MIEFQKKYIEDAGELIAKLESDLIDFENDADNEAIIQEIFRVMHTLKGASGMFGFHRIEEFTHLLEDIYDLIRSEQLAVNKEILNLTFEAVDLLKQLLLTKEILDSEQERHYSSTISLAKKYARATPLNSVSQAELPLSANSQEIFLFRVLFKPDSRILLRGIKPYRIIEELTHLGKNIKFQFNDDSIEIVDNDTFNQYWEIFLEGTVSLEAIKDALLFIDETDYKVETLTDISEESMDTFLSESECIKTHIVVDDLKRQISSIVKVIEKKTPNTVLRTQEKHILSSTSDDSTRVSSEKLDNLLYLVSELIIIHAQFENHSERIKDDKLVRTVKELSKISRSFRDEILSTRLIPIAVISTAMQRLVRDLSQKLGKEVELITEGLSTELDKIIINRIENPIMHIIRNCIDHGLETPEERLRSDKPACGVLRFISFYSGASVFIQIQDDGRGIDTKKIIEKAISKGIMKHDESITTKEIYDLIFMSGFSTATEVSEVSGRGVGLDVVKNVVNELHGEINVESEAGLGTSFTLKLPLTLSIVDALLVNCSNYKILIPISNVIICKYLPSGYFNGKDLQYQFEKKSVPVKRLSELFVSTSTESDFEVLIIISIYEKYYGLLVDRIVTSLQAVIKPLGQMHDNQPYFIGASQLGDGSMAYILDTNFLLKT